MIKINNALYDDLLTIIKTNKTYLKDIWIYGNQSFKNSIDAISDLDLIIIYTKKPIKIKFPEEITKKIKGSTIYVPSKHKKKIFLFEDLKVFSIKKKKQISYKINPKFIKYRSLTSFLERYYERRKILGKAFSYLKPEDLSIIKSLFFSYIIFFNYKNNKMLLRKCNQLMRVYFSIRKGYVKENLRFKNFKNFLDHLKKFDSQFFKFSYDFLETKFDFLNIERFNIFFLNKYNFRYLSKKKDSKVPRIFCYLYYFYSKQKTSLSKRISKDISYKILSTKIHDKNLKDYLKIKIFFLNKIYLDLKKNKFKKGLYRLNNYLL